MPGFSISSTPTTPSSPFNRGHFYFPPNNLYSPSPSTVSSPRNSYRGANSSASSSSYPYRRRLNSYGSQSQYSQRDTDEIIEENLNFMEWENHYQQREQLEEFPGRVPQPKVKSKPQSQPAEKKPKRESKITNFVISALQYVIDSLR